VQGQDCCVQRHPVSCTGWCEVPATRAGTGELFGLVRRWLRSKTSDSRVVRDAVIRLSNPTQHYAWGSKTAIPGLLGFPATSEPLAESWMVHTRARRLASRPLTVRSGSTR
jgi:hypothetical protein